MVRYVRGSYTDGTGRRGKIGGNMGSLMVRDVVGK